MKKLYELGAKTGLTRPEVNRVARMGLLGLIAVGLAGLAGCFRTQKTEVSDGAAKPETLQDIVGSVKGSTSPAVGQDNNGPFPGYPAGTRYNTVSRSDFRRIA